MKFFYAVNCQEKLLCKGVCSHVRFGYYPLGQFFEQFNEYIQDGVFAVNNKQIIQALATFLESVGENRFKVHKELFLKHFQIEAEMETKFCPNFDFELIKFCPNFDFELFP